MFLEDKPHFFGRRKGRVIRKTKTTLLESFLPNLRISKNTAFDKETLFGTEVDEICLEIGFGNGEHIAGQACKNPRTGYIGAEVFQNGVANLLSLITGIKITADLPEKITLEPGRVDNIRIWDDDIRLLFKNMPNQFLDKIYLPLAKEKTRIQTLCEPRKPARIITTAEKRRYFADCNRSQSLQIMDLAPNARLS